jgi:hypothetical protein
MTAHTRVYAPVGGFVGANANGSNDGLFSVVEGSEADIQSVAPSGAALGFPNDAQTLWRFTPANGWQQVIATPPANL